MNNKIITICMSIIISLVGISTSLAKNAGTSKDKCPTYTTKMQCNLHPTCYWDKTVDKCYIKPKP